jgi:hypothetical protein
MGPASMMPKAMPPSGMPACDDGGPCPPMAPCEMDADTGLLDGPAVTP